MKTIRRSCQHRFLVLITVAGLPLCLAAADGGMPSPDHVLFMGADLSVQYGKKLYRVEDVTGSDFKIHVSGEEVFVPTRPGPVSLHVDADLKLSRPSVRLDELKAGPGYTYANDPMRQLEEANRNNLTIADNRDNALAAVPRAEANLAAVTANAPHMDLATAQREMAAATDGLQASHRAVDYVNFSTGSDSVNLGSGAHRAALAEGNFDAMEVSFKASCPVGLDQPYVVILFKFHDPTAKPGVNGLVIHAQALDPIDTKPRYFRVLRGGLPPGFKFVDCAVHLYNRGQEFATSRSDKRVELTRDETRLYLVMNHCGAHKGATLPAAAVPGTLSRAQRANLTPAQLTRTFYAKVAGDGALRGVFTDADCKVPLDDADMKMALGEIFFTPALKEGKAVDGVARTRLSDI